MIEIPGYTVLRLLGQGGMATVYLALQQSLSREVALKVLSPALAQDSVATERFLREARVSAKLHHPNIVAIHDVGVHNGVPYMSIAYEPGGTVAQASHARGDPNVAMRVIRDIANALQYAHSQGVVHRDVKPENILLRKDGSCVLSDFGIAHAFEAKAGLTREGTSVGTPHYMSPEQLRGELVDGRTDLYSLGVVFYQLLTGDLPYQGTDGWAIGIQHITAPVPRLPAHLSQLQGFLDSMLAKEPQRRPQTGSDVVKWVDARLSGRMSAMTMPLPAVGSAESNARSAPPSIAILPFEDMSQGKDQQYLADGLSEELLNLLSKVRGLHVASRSSAFSFKGTSAKLVDIGRELKVATVLEGSVRKFGERVRISVQLINVADGYQMWSETYDRQLTDVFAVQDEIAGLVVEALKIQLLSRQATMASPSRLETAEAELNAAREAQVREAAEKAATEARQREAVAKAATEARRREAAEKAATEARQREAAEKTATEARQREAAEKAAAEARQREAAEKGAAEARQREAAEKAAAEARQREAVEKAAAEARREAAEKAAAEARQREAAEKAAAEARLREAVERAAAEARHEAAEKAAAEARQREAVERAAAEKAAAEARKREATERAAAEARQREAAEKAAAEARREAAERAAAEARQREAEERAAAAEARERKAEEKAVAAEARQREAAERATAAEASQREAVEKAATEASRREAAEKEAAAARAAAEARVREEAEKSAKQLEAANKAALAARLRATADAARGVATETITADGPEPPLQDKAVPRAARVVFTPLRGGIAAVFVLGLSSWLLFRQPSEGPQSECGILLAQARSAIDAGEFDKATSATAAAQTACQGDGLSGLQALNTAIRNGRAKAITDARTRIDPGSTQAADPVAAQRPHDEPSAPPAQPVSAQATKDAPSVAAKAPDTARVDPPVTPTAATPKLADTKTAPAPLDRALADSSRPTTLDVAKVEDPRTQFPLSAQATQGNAAASPPELVAQPLPAAPVTPNRPEPALRELVPISTPQPAYPAKAKRGWVMGSVTASFTVNTDGSVSNVQVLSAYPFGVFDANVVSAVSGWKFQPIDEPQTTTHTFTFKP